MGAIHLAEVKDSHSVAGVDLFWQTAKGKVAGYFSKMEDKVGGGRISCRPVLRSLKLVRSPCRRFVPSILYGPHMALGTVASFGDFKMEASNRAVPFYPVQTFINHLTKSFLLGHTSMKNLYGIHSTPYT